MHEDYYDYDDEEFDNYPNQDQSKFYFKFDPSAWDAWGKWLYDAMKEIVETNPNVWYTPTYIEGWPTTKFPVNSFFSNTGKDANSFQYLGNDYSGSPIWKKKYFISDPIDMQYRAHIETYAAHFLRQPQFYKGMFDILN